MVTFGHAQLCKGFGVQGMWNIITINFNDKRSNMHMYGTRIIHLCTKKINDVLFYRKSFILSSDTLLYCSSIFWNPSLIKLKSTVLSTTDMYLSKSFMILRTTTALKVSVQSIWITLPKESNTICPDNVTKWFSIHFTSVTCFDGSREFGHQNRTVGFIVVKSFHARYLLM